MIIFLHFTKLLTKNKDMCWYDLDLIFNLSHEQSLYQVLKLVLLFSKVFFFHIINLKQRSYEQTAMMNPVNHYKLNCLWKTIRPTIVNSLWTLLDIYCPTKYKVFWWHITLWFFLLQCTKSSTIHKFIYQRQTYRNIEISRIFQK